MRRVCLRRKYAIKRQENARIHGVHAFLFCESTYVVLLNLSVQNALFSGGKDFLDRFSSRNLPILKRNNKFCSLAITAKNDLWISVCAILNVGSDGSYSHKKRSQYEKCGCYACVNGKLTSWNLRSWRGTKSSIQIFFCFSVPCITFLLFTYLISTVLKLWHQGLLHGK